MVRAWRWGHLDLLCLWLGHTGAEPRDLEQALHLTGLQRPYMQGGNSNPYHCSPGVKKACSDGKAEVQSS